MSIKLLNKYTFKYTEAISKTILARLNEELLSLWSEVVQQEDLSNGEGRTYAKPQGLCHPSTEVFYEY